MASVSAYQGLRVLVAEDNEGHRRMISAVLTSLGCRPEVVPDGRAAVAAAEGERFDLILMDIAMPVMDGLTAIRLIRGLEKQSHHGRTPLYVLSSQDEPSNLMASRLAGADGHLAKPVRVSLLLQAIGHAQENRQAQSRGRRSRDLAHSQAAA